MANLFKSFTSSLQNGFERALDNSSNDYIDDYEEPPPEKVPEPHIDTEELEKYKRKLMECKDELDKTQQTLHSVQDDFSKLQKEKDAKINELNDKIEHLQENLQQEISKSLSFQDIKQIDSDQYDSLQHEFSLYKQDSELRETKLINELDDTKNALDNERKRFTASQANVAEILRQLNEFKKGTGSYMYKCNDCPQIMTWVESLLLCLTSYLSKRPREFQEPPKSLPESICQWANDQINTAQSIGSSMAAFRSSMLEKAQFEVSLCDSIKPLLVKLEILDSEDSVDIDKIFDYISQIKDEIDSYTTAYQSIVSGKKKNEEEDYKTKIMILEEEKKTLVLKLTTQSDTYEKEKEGFLARLQNYEQQIANLQLLGNDSKNILEQYKELQQDFSAYKKQKVKDDQKYVDDLKMKDILINQKDMNISSLMGENMEWKRKYNKLIDNISSNTNSSFFSKNNNTNASVMSEVEKQKIQEESMQKYLQLLEKYQELEINYKKLESENTQTKLDVEEYFKQIQTLQSFLKESREDSRRSEYTKQIDQLKHQINENNIQISTIQFENENKRNKLKNEYDSKLLEIQENCKIQINKSESETFELRKVLRDQQASHKSYCERIRCEYRLLRQLLITYMTAVEGGPSLKILMEKLNLSTDEQKVCLQAQIQKIQPKTKNTSTGFFGFLWRNIEDSMSSKQNTNSISFDENASLSDLWVQFLMNETET